MTSDGQKKWYNVVDPGEPLAAVELDMEAVHGAQAARARFPGRTSPQGSREDLQRALRIAGAIRVDESAQKESESAAEVGSLAPLFRAVTYDGKMVDLKALRGKKVWLIFYRYATCPLCNLHLKWVIDRYPAMKKAGLEVVVVFESAVPQFFQPGQCVAPPFPIVADPKKLLYRLYGTRSSIAGVLHPAAAQLFVRSLLNGFKQGSIQGDFGQLPSHFLIDAEGIIKTAHHGKNAADHLSWVKIGIFAKIPPQEILAP